MDPDAVAKAFVEHYYTTFDANRAGLVSLYQEGSMLTFEGQKIQGSQNIVAKLTSLPFQQCKHNITTVDCQPSGPAGGMLVFVSDVPFGVESGKLLRVQRHIQVELCLRNVVEGVLQKRLMESWKFAG
ncbi:nuclear transport factor 2A isoform X1 [Brassica napus]|uniref:nuclear transport factor 2-like isoform X1 n=1 Tax=Brassica oleracea var. oleracea TaxID=109376 RepID=UPI0006A736E9|nr:PREDICTED: nuclear transport factor 2-like isoform X1 [Brassica oleracea var. oleracea]XP_022545935.1 nuclear transport factor 2A isoform X1 [Brassica napus]